MNYKSIITNATTRQKILRFLSFIPDKQMLELQYRIKTGRKLNLKNPKRYTEKIQWYKLYYRSDEMLQCSDKWLVREYVKKRGLSEILNDNYGLFANEKEIDWGNLPYSFVLKDTLGGGGRSIIFVHNKDQMDKEKIQSTLRSWSSIKCHKSSGREWVYENRKHSIIAEKMLLSKDSQDLPDYKFFCFDGKVYCSYMMRNYTLHHDLGELGFFDRDFNLLKAHRRDFKPITEQPEKPENYTKMIEIAETLAYGFPHVRVDLYNIDGKIVFGEMTFFNASGYFLFEPDEFDFQLGEQFVLPSKYHL